jgi:gamma-glutamylcyclotransferase (GGCT)/AIG2-like uncharacterized protein YtfP
MSVRYFAYGSNMHAGQMAERAPTATVVAAGRLDGYRLEFNVYSKRWEGGAANLEPEPEAHVWGVVWEMDDKDLAALDTFSGHPTFYRREQVDVHTPSGVETCFTYRVAHQSGFVRPTEPYMGVLRSAIEEQGLPEEALSIVERAAKPWSPTIST